jgi:hypothetical protein
MSNPYMLHCHIDTMNKKFMNNNQETVQEEKRRKMSPKTGGRGIRDPTKPRDKNVRITSDLYEEMMKYIRSKYYDADFYDVCSEAWECLKKEHHQGK